MKKLFTLLTLALISIGSAWGEFRTILLYDATVNGSITTTPIGDFVALTGVSQGNGNSMYGIQFKGNLADDKYISITLPSSATLAAGDQIVITHFQSGTGSPANNYGTYVTGTTSTTVDDKYKFGIPTSQAKNAAAVTYTVAADDDLIGKSTFYVRGYSPASDKSSFVQKIEVKQYYVDTRDALTLSFTPDNKIIQPEVFFNTSLNWTEDISSEIAKYTISYVSSDNAIATVDTDGKVTGVSEGTVTITATVTATEDATYKTTSKSITVIVKALVSRYENTPIPTSALDFNDVSAVGTMLSGTWNTNYGRPIFGNDGANSYMTFSVVAAYSATSSQTWVGAYVSGSTGQSWDETGVFKGSSAYMSTAKAATTKSNAGLYSFRVKGVSKVQALASARNSTQKVIMAAYPYEGSTLSSTTTLYEKYGSGNDIGTLTLNLDDATEYLITISADATSTNSRLYEIALFYDNAIDFTNVEVGEYEWATYVNSSNALDFTGSDVKAYIVTGHSGSAITKSDALTTVAANTPLLLNASKGTYVIPVAASGTDYSGTNLLKAGDGSDIAAVTGKTRYVLGVKSDKATFLKIASTAATVPVGKAYLEFNETIEARSIDLGGDVTAIKNIKVGTEDNIYYDLQGRRVLYPKKGLYIVNGKKVIIK